MNIFKTKNASVLLSVLAVMFCFCILSCKNKSSEEKKDEIIKSIEKKANKEFCFKVAKSILENRFSQIDTITMEESKTRINSNSSVSVHAKGKVVGLVKNNKKDEYDYDINTDIWFSKMDTYNPLDDNFYNITVRDKDGYYIFCKVGVNEYAEEYNKGLEVAKEMHKKDIKIDGITIEYGGEYGASYVYSSKKELTPEQIVKVISKIDRGSVDMIQFKINGEKYADYIYKTRCIIYVKYTDKIYKIVDGSPVRL